MFPFDIKKSLQWDGIFSISQDSFNRSDVLFKQKSAVFCSVCWFTIPGFNFSDVVVYTENDVFFAWQWRFIPKSNTLLNRHAILQYTLHVSKHDNVGNGTCWHVLFQTEKHCYGKSNHWIWKCQKRKISEKNNIESAKPCDL